MPVPSTLIPNSYDQTLFYEAPAGTHSEQHELVFAGRLVSSKGVDLALESLAILARQNLHPRLTIIGEGPERNALESLTAYHGLESQVTFTGPLQGVALTRQFQRHRIQLVPSRWAEPRCHRSVRGHFPQR